MVIYLQHPKHGSKVAVSDLEAISDEKNGWSRYTPGEPEGEEVNTLRTKRAYTRKPKDEPEGE